MWYKYTKKKCEHVVQVHGNHSGINGESPDMHQNYLQFNMKWKCSNSCCGKGSLPNLFSFLRGRGKRGEVDVAKEVGTAR